MKKELKIDKAKRLYLDGDIKGSLKFFKTLKIGFTSAERRAMQIAHEAMVGNEKFYRSLGIDVDEERRMAIRAINKRYQPKNNKML